jgi:hypothetical protein
MGRKEGDKTTGPFGMRFKTRIGETTKSVHASAKIFNTSNFKEKKK